MSPDSDSAGGEETGLDPCRLAMDLVPMMVVAVDAEGKIRLFNREAERVSGWSRSDAIGADFGALLMPIEHAGASREIIAAVGDLQRDAKIPRGLKTRSGRVIDVAWSARRPGDLDAQGRLVALFVFGEDEGARTERQHRERRVEKLAALGTLAAGLAHELRNPLNGAQLHLTLLERSLRKLEGHPELLDSVMTIEEQIRRLGELVTDFLDFARPLPLRRVETSVVELCQRAREGVLSLATRHRVEVVLDIPETDVKVLVDPLRFQQVLENLLINAIEALELVGGGTATLRARADPGVVSFEVEDEGPGLPSTKEPIFDAFFTTKPNASGLGLSIAHRIVTEHDGSIAFDSEGGRTVFSIRIPLPDQV